MSFSDAHPDQSVFDVNDQTGSVVSIFALAFLLRLLFDRRWAREQMRQQITISDDFRAERHGAVARVDQQTVEFRNVSLQLPVVAGDSVVVFAIFLDQVAKIVFQFF